MKQTKCKGCGKSEKQLTNSCYAVIDIPAPKWIRIVHLNPDKDSFKQGFCQKVN